MKEVSESVKMHQNMFILKKIKNCGRLTAETPPATWARFACLPPKHLQT